MRQIDQDLVHITILSLLIFFLFSGLTPSAFGNEVRTCSSLFTDLKAAANVIDQNSFLGAFEGDMENGRKNRWQWVDIQQRPTTVFYDLSGKMHSAFLENGKIEIVSDPSESIILSNEYFAAAAPSETELIMVDYPNHGPGLAYRVRADMSIYSDKLEPDAKGAVQIPGLPPFYVTVIDGTKYIDVPHPEVFNRYLGRDYFVSYTSKRFEPFKGQIPPLVYQRIMSENHFPIANVMTDVRVLLHDVIGHAIVMAAIYKHPIWKQSVEITHATFGLMQAIGSSDLPIKIRSKFQEGCMQILRTMSLWEVAANGSKVYKCRTPEELDLAIQKIDQELRAPFHVAEEQLIQLKREFSSAIGE